MQAAGRFAILGAFLAMASPEGAAAQMALPLKHAPARTQTAITPADLMTRLYLYSDDSMMGRLAGSEYNLKATAYIASEVKRLGLQPGGDSGGEGEACPPRHGGPGGRGRESTARGRAPPWCPPNPPRRRRSISSGSRRRF